MLRLLQRLLAALPDAVTAAVFLAAWVMPTRFGPEYVRNLSPVMAMEFVVIHSSVIYAVIAGADIARRKRVVWLARMSCLYLVIVVAFALEYRSTWPILAFAWLFVSRFLQVWISPAANAAQGARMVKLWAISVVANLAGAFAVNLIPLPSLGMDSAFVSSMLRSGGTGLSRGAPHTMLAFGFGYFAILAAAKLTMGSAANARHPPASVHAPPPGRARAADPNDHPGG